MTLLRPLHGGTADPATPPVTGAEVLVLLGLLALLGLAAFALWRLVRTRHAPPSE